MDDDMGGSSLREDQLINADEMDGVIREAVESALGTAAFMHSKINAWTSNVVLSLMYYYS
eukprot:gene11822-13956_t